MTPLHYYLRVDQALCVRSEPGKERNCSPRSSLQVSAPCCCYSRVRRLDWEMRLLTVSSCRGQSLVSSGVDQPRPGHLCKADIGVDSEGGSGLVPPHTTPGPAVDTPRWRLTRDGPVQEEAAVAAGSAKTHVTLTPELILVT